MYRAINASKDARSVVRVAVSRTPVSRFAVALAVLVPGCDAALALRPAPLADFDTADATRCLDAAHVPTLAGRQVEVLQAYIAGKPRDTRRVYVDARLSAHGAAYTRRLACEIGPEGHVRTVKGRPVPFTVRAGKG